jgi:hypothetical protein
MLFRVHYATHKLSAAEARTRTQEASGVGDRQYRAHHEPRLLLLVAGALGAGRRGRPPPLGPGLGGWRGTPNSMTAPSAPAPAASRWNDGGARGAADAVVPSRDRAVSSSISESRSWPAPRAGRCSIGIRAQFRCAFRSSGSTENGANDVKVEDHGRAWVGTMALDKRAGDLRRRRLTISNGPAVDQSRGRFYVGRLVDCSVFRGGVPRESGPMALFPPDNFVIRSTAGCPWR